MEFTVEDLANIKQIIIEKYRASITEHWEPSISNRPPMSVFFGYIYLNTFKELDRELTRENCSMLRAADTNIKVAINAFLKYRDEPELEDLLDFVEIFISEHINQFYHWYYQ